MMDFNKFIKDNMKEALSKMPPEQRADMNRMVQKIGNSMSAATTSNKDLSGDILAAHEDFKDRLAKTQEVHNEMQTKYADNSSK